MTNYFIIGGDGKPYGPITEADVRKWFGEGRLNAQTQTRTETETAWRPLVEFPEFADLFSTRPSADAPPPAGSDELTAGDYELDIGGCFSRAWELVKNNFWSVVGVNALILILIAAFNQLTGLLTRPAIDAMIRHHQVSPGGIALIALVSILSAPVYMILMAGLLQYFLKLVRNEPAGVGDAFAGFGPMSGQLILLGLVMNLLIWIGYVLCIIPGLFLQVAWLFALPLIMDRQLNFWAAMELSRKRVCQHWFIVFAFLVVYTLVALAGLIACCIGIFVSTPIALGAWMYAYETLFSRPQTD